MLQSSWVCVSSCSAAPLSEVVVIPYDDALGSGDATEEGRALVHGSAVKRAKVIRLGRRVVLCILVGIALEASGCDNGSASAPPITSTVQSAPQSP